MGKSSLSLSLSLSLSRTSLILPLDTYHGAFPRLGRWTWKQASECTSRMPASKSPNDYRRATPELPTSLQLPRRCSRPKANALSLARHLLHSDASRITDITGRQGQADGD